VGAASPQDLGAFNVNPQAIGTPADEPYRLNITDVHDGSFTVSWVTGNLCNGFVEVDTDPAFSAPTAHYDVRGDPQADDIHSVEVSGLSAGTTYYFRIRSGAAGSETTWFRSRNVLTWYNQTVNPVKVDTVEIRDGAGAGANNLSAAVSIAAGYGGTYYVAAFNATYGYLYDTPANWSVSVQTGGGAGIGWLASDAYASGWNWPGSDWLNVSYQDPITSIWRQDSVRFDLVQPTTDSIEIRDGAGGGASNVTGPVSIGVGTAYPTLYAARFNQTVYLNDIDQAWSFAAQSGGSLAPGGVSFTQDYTSGVTGASSDWVNVTYDGRTDSLRFDVLVAEYDEVRIVYAADGSDLSGGTASNYTVDPDRMVKAEGWNSTANVYVGDIAVEWGSSDVGVALVTPGPGVYANVSFVSLGWSNITARDGTGRETSQTGSATWVVQTTPTPAVPPPNYVIFGTVDSGAGTLVYAGINGGSGRVSTITSSNSWSLNLGNLDGYTPTPGDTIDLAFEAANGGFLQDSTNTVGAASPQDLGAFNVNPQAIGTPADEPSRINLTSRYDTGFSVSWVTSNPCNGFVEVDTDPAFSAPTAHYDVRGDPQSDDAHHVEVSGLASDTTYYVRLRSGASGSESTWYQSVNLMAWYNQTVDPVTVNAIEIRDGTGAGAGNLTNSVAVAAGYGGTYYAAAFNDTYGYLYDVSPNWTFSQQTGGSASTGFLASSTYAAGWNWPGSDWLNVSFQDPVSGAWRQDSVRFDLAAPTADTIEMRDGAGAGAVNVTGPLTVAAGYGGTYFAARFNQTVYLGDITPTWAFDQQTGGSANTGVLASSTYTAGWNWPGSDWLNITDGANTDSVRFDLVAPTTDTVEIRDAAGAGGNNVTSPVAVAVGYGGTYFAAEFNQTVYLGDITPAWSFATQSGGGADTGVLVSSTYAAGWAFPASDWLNITAGLRSDSVRFDVVAPTTDSVEIRDGAGAGANNATTPINVAAGYSGGQFRAARFNQTVYLADITDVWSFAIQTGGSFAPGITPAASQTHTAGWTIGSDWLNVTLDGQTDSVRFDLVAPTTDSVEIRDGAGAGANNATSPVNVAAGYSGGQFRAARFNQTVYLGDVGSSWSFSVQTGGGFNPGAVVAASQTHTAGWNTGSDWLNVTYDGRTDSVRFDLIAPTTDTVEIRDGAGAGANNATSPINVAAGYSGGQFRAARFNQTVYLGDIGGGWSFAVQTGGGFAPGGPVAASQTHTAGWAVGSDWLNITAGGSSDSVRFDLVVPTTDSVEIRDGAGASANNITGPVTIAIGAPYPTLHAARFNQTVFLGDIDQTWSFVSQSGGTLSPGGISLAQDYTSGVASPASDWVNVTYGGETDSLRFDVLIPSVDSVELRDGAGAGAQNESDQAFIPIGSTYTTLYAAAFNGTVGYLYDITQTWNLDSQSGGALAPGGISPTQDYTSGASGGVSDWVNVSFGGQTDSIRFDIYDPILSLTDVAAAPAIQKIHGSVNVTANVTGGFGAYSVWLNVTHPDGSTVNVSMTKGPGNQWYAESVFHALGNYPFEVWVTDLPDLWNKSSGSFDIIPRPVHNLDSGWYFDTIQGALDDPLTLDGHRLTITPEVFTEDVSIDGKRISIVDSSFALVGNLEIVNGGSLSIDPTWMNLTGNIYVDGGSELSLAETVLRINSTFDGEFGIRVNSSAYLNISDSSVIMSGTAFTYTHEVRGRLVARDSVMRDHVELLLEHADAASVLDDVMVADWGFAGVRLNSSTLLAVNTTFSGTGSYDLVMGNGSTMTTLNTTFDDASVSLPDAGSALVVKWFLDVLVLNGDSLPVPGSMIDIYDTANATGFTGTAGDDGTISWAPVTEYVETLAARTYMTPHRVIASRTGYYPSETTLNLTTTRNVTIVLRLEEPPGGEPLDINVAVSAGLLYSSAGVEYDVIAMVTVGGAPHVHAANTTVLVTVYDDAMSKVVDNGTMAVLDGASGLYNYTGNLTGTGVFFVVVTCNVSGQPGTGMTSFEVVDWIGEISDINASLAALNQTLDAIQQQLDALAGMEGNISAQLDQVNATVMTEIAAVNASLAVEIQLLLASVTDDITGLNDSLGSELAAYMNDMAANDTALAAWLDAVLEQVEANLTSVAASVEAGLQGQGDIADQLAMLNDTLEELAALQDILARLDALNRSLEQAQEEVAVEQAEEEDEPGEPGGSILNTILLILLLILVIILLLVSLVTMRKKPVPVEGGAREERPGPGSEPAGTDGPEPEHVETPGPPPK